MEDIKKDQNEKDKAEIDSDCEVPDTEIVVEIRSKYIKGILVYSYD